MQKFVTVLSDLNKALDRNEDCSVFGLSFGEKAFFLSSQQKQVLFVTNSLSDASRLAEQLESFGKIVKTIFYKPNDITLGSFTNGINVANSIDAIYSLSTQKVDCLIISPEILLQKFPKKQVYKKSIFSLKVGQSIDREDIIAKLINIGYSRVDLVTSHGEFSVRGDTIDVFNIKDDLPTRIEFFDIEIEKITEISLENSKKLKEKKNFDILPNSFFVFENIQELYDLVKKDFEETYKKLEPNQAVILKSNFEEFKLNFESGNLSYCQNWLVPYLQQNSIENFLNEDALLVFDDVKQIYDAVKVYAEQSLNTYNLSKNTGNILIGAKNFDISFDNVFNFDRQKLSFQQITNANKIFNPTFVLSYKTSATTNFFGNYNLLLQDIKYYEQFDYTTIVFCKTKQTAEYLQNFLKTNKIDANLCDFDAILPQKVNLIAKNVPYGAIFVEDKIAIIGSKELLKKETEKSKKLQTESKKEEFVLPKIGDYVVHEKFGIGLCVGIEKLKFTDYQKDYIILQYQNGDKLYLPTEQVGLISAYVGNGKEPKLNNLGTKDFEKTKEKVKSSIKKLAFNLLELYSARESAKGFKFEVDEKLFSQFENDFAFSDTPDQANAVLEIKKDMQNGKVMDRLLCGDVGYGKTEVAIRSAFISAQNDKQVVFLAPTTVLSQQHYNTAKQRLAPYGIEVECLNRFKTKEEQKQIIEKLKTGQIDVICGTHRLLSKDVVFKDLGLLILDEEQRFGVGDKEKIKNLKKDVDVLTLSATPIPRTLHMGLSGIRDISLLTTAPEGRLPVQTTVTEYSDALLLQAINRELSRDGQVLVIYNRVETILQFASHIKSLLSPDIKIGVAHGQMDQAELEKQIFDLYQGTTKVLISTTLIENGIDLPNANTLIVTNADKLGLSQLYQLKGRVGRSKNLGYAYFLYDDSKEMTSDAYKRLNALMEFTELGSGFKIAMRDLEIRGCGNILGPEQSGHMAKIGYDLYCKILREAVAEIKGQKAKEYKELKLDVATNCYIPESYIQNSDDRFRIYTNLKQINSTESLTKVLTNIQNLYGEVPQEITNLGRVAMLRNLAREFDAKFVAIDRTRCLCEFYDKQSMLQKPLVDALKTNEIKAYYANTGAIMNFALAEYSVKRKLELVCDVFEDAVKNLQSAKK